MNNKYIGGGIVAALFVIYIGGGMYASSKAETKVDELISSLGSSSGDIKYDDISASVFGDVTIDGFTMGKGKESFFIETLELEGFDDIDEDSADILIRASGVKLSGLRVDSTPDNPNEAIMFQWVEKGAEVDFELDVSIDGDSDMIEIGNLSFNGDTIGKMTFSGEIEGFASALLKAIPALQNEDPQGLMSLMSVQSVSFGDLELTIEDDGIADILLAREINDSMPDIDDVRDNLIEKTEKRMERMSKQERVFAEGGLGLLKGDGMRIELEGPLTFKTSELMNMSQRNLMRKVMAANLTVDNF